MITEAELKKVLIEKEIPQEKIQKFQTLKLNTLYKRGNKNNISGIIDILKREKLLDLIYKCPTILTYGKKQGIEEIIKLIKATPELSLDIIRDCSTILAQGKKDEIEEIIKLIKESPELNLDIINDCPTILARGKKDEIEEIIKLIKATPKLSLDIINQCPTILARGKKQEIESIIKLIKETPELSLDIINQCSSILARGKKDEIESIIKLIKDNPELSFDIINNCPTILALGKKDEIESIIKLIKETPELSLDIINDCPSILVLRKKEEIEEIIKLIKATPELSLDIIRDCPTILALGKKQEIEEIIKIINKYNANINMLSYKYFYGKAKDVEDMFLQAGIKERNEKFYQREKQYFKLINFYNKNITLEEINGYCLERNLTIEEFVINVCNEAAFNDVMKTLGKQGYIYFGDKIAMTAKMMEENKELLIEIPKNVAGTFIKTFSNKKHLYDELLGFILDIIIEKCGSFFINYKYSEELLSKILYKYCYKWCYTFSSTNYQEFYDNKRSKINKSDIEYNENLDSKYSYLTKQELAFLKQMSYYVEEGYQDYINKLSEYYKITEEEVKQNILTLRNKIADNI